MISRKAFWSVTLTLAVVGVVSGTLIGNAFAPQPPAHAAWKDVFEAPSQLARNVDSIVLAKAVAVEPGRVAQSSDGNDILPFQVYEFEVVRGLKGVEQGERVLVERAGGVAPNGQRFVLDVDGGAYELGATYLLFLNKQPDSPFYFQVNDQGRYLVAENRLFGIDPNDSVVEFFEGKPVSEGLSSIRGFLRERPLAN